MRFSTVKSDKTVSLKFTDALLARAGIEGTVSLWDSRLLGKGAPIHVFNRTALLTQVQDVNSTHSILVSTSLLVERQRR